MLIFSIHRQHVEAMLAGRKGFEYRTRRPAIKRGDRFLIYETTRARGRGLVVAVATVRKIVDGTPDHVWKVTADRAGITREEFDLYFAGRDRAVAVGVDVVALRQPVALPEGVRAPQSWGTWTGPTVVCHQCSAETGGRSLCEAHRKRQRAWVADRVAAGVCPRCGEQVEDGRRWCAACRAKTRAKRAALAESGVCYRCATREVVAGGRTCAECLSAARSKRAAKADETPV
jgi:predicted transcriptional regulator